MRTKTLLLTAVMTAVLLVASVRQVFSSTVVGVVTKSIPPRGFALISNPFLALDNSINALFSPAPAGLQVFKFDSGKGGFTIATFDDFDGAFLPADVAATEVLPGEGVFVRNPTDVAITITFVGEAFFLSKQQVGSWDRSFSVSE